MTIHTTRHRLALAGVLAAALIPATASAASFYIIESSPARLGNAFAGTASEAGDASTAYFNPAGMSRLDGSNITAAAHYVMPVAKFDNNGSTTSAGTPLGGPDAKTDETAVVPNFYYTTPLNDAWSFGLAVNAPFGLESSYKDNWVGRYHATDSSLSSLSVNPNVSYRVNDRLSFGFGVSYQRVDATLENQVDSFAACFAAGGGLATCGSVYGGPGNASTDSSAKVTGDDSGWGANLGFMYAVDPETRVGASWRQGIDYTLSGKASFDRSGTCTGDPFCSGALNAKSGDIKADLNLPDILTLSATHAVNDRWTLAGDVAWYGWSTLDKVKIVKKSDGSEVSTLQLDYNDTYRYSLGVTYADGGPWTYRGGIAYDQSPISGKDTVTPRIPDGDRTWLSFGFNYAVSPMSSVDVGYAHLFVDNVKIENTTQGNTLKGTFDPKVDILAVSGNWKF